MAKADTKNRRKRLSKVVNNEPVEDEENPTTGEQSESVSSAEHLAMIEDDGNKNVARRETPEEDGDRQESEVVYKVKGSRAPTVTVSRKMNNEGDEEKQTATDEVTAKNMMDKDSEMETVTYEVKGSTVTTVSVSWEKEDEAKRTDANDQMTADEMMDKAGETITTVERVITVEEAPKEKKQEQEIQEIEEPEDKQVKGKRKAESTVTTSPPKKVKLINDGYCLYIGNLKKSTKFEELKNSLATYFMTHSLLVQDIRLARSKTHAHVDLASQMDLTKALTLNGEKVLGQPLKIRKAKVKVEEEVKVKDPLRKKKAKDARCLFLKNVPHTATKQDILKLFPKATAVRFFDGAESPKKGIAFVEFQNKAIAERAQRKGQKAKIQGQVLIVDTVNKPNKPEMNKANNDTKSNTKAAPPPNKILFVSNLSEHVTEENLKKVYQTAINITIPKNNRKSRGLAFVEFATVEDAEKAMQSSQNVKIRKRKIKVQFYLKPRPQAASVLSKTLFVKGLAEKTTAQTLKSAFEGALSAKVIVDKDTGVSKKFGFVDFKTEEACKSAKDAFEDCEIEGSKVTVLYARPRPIRRVLEEPMGGH
ncbi:nucleolin-like isoform X2 [Sphaeramia orbicularis]|uniref:nucleolin-like isoform X2 n=1 Tax=Sphaeramia orbicularis TaxID=375764 RepID=UPI00117FD076|nr:nucleolin-like isoform X2 [Sphaeramia orbicularis]